MAPGAMAFETAARSAAAEACVLRCLGYRMSTTFVPYFLAYA